MSTPVEALLNEVTWTVEPPQEPGDLPHVTHSGVMELFGNRLRCYRLSDGRAIFDADDFTRTFESILT